VVPWAHRSPLPKGHLDRFSRFCKAQCTDRQTDRQTDRSTDHATRSVTTEHIYVRSTAMRPNSNNNTYLYSDLKPLNTQALACVMHMHLVSWTHNNCNGGLNIVNRSPIEINSKTNTANVFLYPSFGVGCSEVEIDCLTGDHTVTF